MPASRRSHLDAGPGPRGVASACAGHASKGERRADVGHPLALVPARPVPAVGPDDRGEDAVAQDRCVPGRIRRPGLLRELDLARDPLLMLLAPADDELAPLVAESLDVVVVDRHAE